MSARAAAAATVWRHRLGVTARLSSAMLSLLYHCLRDGGVPAPQEITRANMSFCTSRLNEVIVSAGGVQWTH